MSESYALWLLPSSAQQARWQSRIDALAREHGGPRFEAHLTLASPVSMALDSARTQLALMARKHSPLTLNCEQLDAGERRFRCLSMLLHSNSALEAMCEDCQTRFHFEYSDYTPHISLLYVDPKTVDAKAIIDGLEGLPSQVNFNRLALMDCSGDVSTWHTLETLVLEH